jgi:hypothetical protein
MGSETTRVLIPVIQQIVDTKAESIPPEIPTIRVSILFIFA